MLCVFGALGGSEGEATLGTAKAQYINIQNSKYSSTTYYCKHNLDAHLYRYRCDMHVFQMELLNKDMVVLECIFQRLEYFALLGSMQSTR